VKLTAEDMRCEGLEDQLIKTYHELKADSLEENMSHVIGENQIPRTSPRQKTRGKKTDARDKDSDKDPDKIRKALDEVLVLHYPLAAPLL